MTSRPKSAGAGAKKPIVRDVTPLPSQFEEELDRIRTEGDLTLIKVQTEKQKLKEIEAKLAEAQKLLKERKKPKQSDKDTSNSEVVSNAQVSLAFGGTIDAGKQLPSKSQSAKDAERVEAKKESTRTVNAEKLLQTEERLKIAVAERSVELQKLRQDIDELRRKRLNALASEKEVMKDILEAEEDAKKFQAETTQLKHQTVDLKNEIAALEVEFDMEKQAFRSEQQKLLMELEEATKSDKQDPEEPAPVSHKYSVFHNMARRKKNPRLSKWKKVTMDQKIVSFEQKKRMLDRIIEETNVKNMSEFIEKYIVQERIKAEVFAKIEAQTASNDSLKGIIGQLAEDIARLSGVSDSDSLNIDDSEKPSVELQQLFDADDAKIKRWAKDADIFADAVKLLREPIYDLHKVFFPGGTNEDALDDAIPRELGMLRRIGAIEERVMQFIMAKILEETGSASTLNNSDTLRRLRQYQGRREQIDPVVLSASKLDGVELPSTLKGDSSPRKEAKGFDDDDDDDDFVRDVTVLHSDAIRQKFNKIRTENNAQTTGSVSGGSPRKNAVITM